MKIACPCGAVIPDGGDATPNKAWLLADQDLPDAPRRAVLQCHRCGRLCLGHPVTGAVLWFRPEGEAAGALGSAFGDRHMVQLTGGWQDWQDPPKGDLHWGTSGTRPGGFESFDSLAALERRYHEVLARLQAEGRLASAWLHRGEVTLHEWPGK